MFRSFALTAALVPVSLLVACAGMQPQAKPFDQANLPDAVKVPAGNKVAWETVGVGQITYECRAKNAPEGTFEWVFVGPQADLNNRAGAKVGTYYGPPATWASSDGSKLTGTQLAVAPGGTGNIPLQLVKANPATGAGQLTGVTHIQRVATQGGVAPSTACTQASAGSKEIVKYQADYIFWKAE
jgi:hypothetical protein